MIILRIAEGIRSHFPARKSEWVLAGISVGWGWKVMTGPPGVFDTNLAYAPLVRWTPWSIDPSDYWGGMAIAMGVVRLLALVINGTFARSWYGRWSPHARAFLAFVTCFLWTQIGLGLWSSPEDTTGRIVYPMLCLLDVLNALDALRDSADVDKQTRNAAASS